MRKEVEAGILNGRRTDTGLVEVSLAGLDLTDQELADILQAEVVSELFIRRLDLSRNKISDLGAQALAAYLERDVCMIDVDLSHNQIQSAGGKELQSVLTRNDSVLQMKVNDNSIPSTIEAQIAELCILNRKPLNLKRLVTLLEQESKPITDVDLDEHQSQRFIDDEGIQILCKHLEFQQHVTTVNLSNNRLTQKGVPSVGYVLKNNMHIQSLDLSGNPLGSGVRDLMAYLKENVGLTFLGLSSCRVDDDGAEAIAEALEFNQNLAHVNLACNPITSKGGRVLSDMFARNPAWEMLELRGCEMEASIFEDIARASKLHQQPPHLVELIQKLHFNDPTMETVDASYNAMIHKAPLDVTGIRYLMESVNHCTLVRRLILNGNSFGGDALQCLCKYLKMNKTVTELSIVDNRPLLDSFSAKLLTEMLPLVPQITNVNLSRNILTEVGAEYFLKLLSAHPSVKRVKLAENDINPGLLAHINLVAKANYHPPALKAMLLQYLDKTYPKGVWDMSSFHGMNLIDGKQWLYDDAAIEYVCKRILANSEDFHTLKVSHNKITTRGVKAIVELLDNSPCFTALDISANDVDDEGAKLLLKCLHGPTMKVIHAAENAISPDLMASINQAVVYNSFSQEIKDLLLFVETNDPKGLILDAAHLKGALEDIHVETIVGSLARNDHIQILKFDNNEFTQRGLRSLIKVATEKDQIKSLSASNSALEGDFAAGLRPMLLKKNGLEELILEDNHFSDVDVECVIECITLCDSLKRCSFKGNPMIPAEMHHRLKRGLALNNHLPLKRVCFQLMENSPDLSAVQLDGQRLDDICLEVLAESLASHKNIQRVSLSGNFITDIGVGHMSNWLASKACHIDTLNLSFNQITVDGCRLLANALLNQKALKVLDLCHNRIDDHVKDVFDKLMEHNNTIVEIILAGNSLRNSTMVHLDCNSLNTQLHLKAALPKLFANDASITELNYGGTKDAKSTANDVTCKNLAEALSANNRVTSLDLSYSEITETGVEFLIDMLAANHSIRKLKLDQCEIRDGTAKLMASMLLDNACLTDISMKSNRLTDEGCLYLQKALISNHTLKRLNVDLNPGISERCYMTLGYAITLNNEPLKFKEAVSSLHTNTVQSLDFSRKGDTDTPFTDSTVALLCTMLAKNSSLTTLNLSGNEIGDYGATCLADVMLDKTTLTSLNLFGNKVGTEGAMNLVTLLMQNQDIKHINLKQNEAGSDKMEQIENLLELNNHPLSLKQNVLRIWSRDTTFQGVQITNSAPPDMSASDKVECIQPDRERFGTCSTKLLCQKLQSFPFITAIDFSNNFIGDEGAICLADLLTVNPTAYTSIIVTGNVITDKGGAKLIDAILESTVGTFHIDNNLLGDASALRLSHLLRTRYDFHDLKFTCDRMSDPNKRLLTTLKEVHKVNEGLRDLCHRLVDGDPSLTALELSNGFERQIFHDRNGACCREFLGLLCDTASMYRNKVTSLDLSLMFITQSEMPYISKLMCNPILCSIVELNLSSNSIEDVDELATAIRYNTVIEIIDLEFNQIAKAKAHPLVTALKGHKSMTTLKIWHNPVMLGNESFGIWGGQYSATAESSIPLWKQLQNEVSGPIRLHGQQ